MFAGLYANWLALSFMILSFTLLIEASSQNSRRILLASIVMSSLILLTHPLSWMVFIAVLSFYSSISLLALHIWKQTETKRCVLFSLGILLSNVVLALSLLFLSNLSAELVVSYAIGGAEHLQLGADSLSKFPAHLQVTLRDYIGGFLANPLTYFLAAVGALQVGYGRNFERLLYSWLIPTSIVFLLTGSLDQWRMLYYMPIHVLATLGVFQLTRKAGLILPNQEFEGGRIISKLFKGSLLCLIILSLFNYAARSINLLFLLFIY